MISTPKILHHTRSSSLPSRSHPLIPQFNHHLQSLHPDSTSLLSIAENLTTLDNLYNCLDDLLLLHHTHHLFSRESHHKWVHQVLDGYLSLVDACATAIDILSHAKEHILHLHSFLRRRRDSDHLCASRKTAKKMIHKTLRHITSLKHKPSVLALADKDTDTIAVISMLKETEAVTLDLIESLLCSVSGSKSSSSGWSLVSRLIGSRRWSGQDDHDHKHRLEFSELDATLEKLVRFDGAVQVDELGLQLREMEESLGVVEDKVEGLFKRLVRTRVSLLNMHSK
ncbi:hypothetical protein AAHA92_25447 [Salvia divinorum]|uniref:Uncharacterized protein n=1 Tax=Salvia divinorum TaxID=28513 RepID=A0ABD1GDC0_SALDI